MVARATKERKYFSDCDRQRAVEQAHRRNIPTRLLEVEIGGTGSRMIAFDGARQRSR